MRIIAGRLKGLRLAAVGKGDANAHLRPTTDRVRESLFNVLANQIDFADLTVLDLFAGTGALGLEALSRGASQVTFVENGRAGGVLISQNISLANATDQTELLRTDATRLPTGQPYDLIFLDPPYGKGLGELAVNQVFTKGWAAQKAMIVWEESAAPNVPSDIEILDQRSYGNTIITICEGP